MQTAGGGVIAILQARMNSSRLPGKVLRPVNGKPLIEWQIRRIQESKFISKLVLATSTDGSDDDLNDFVIQLGVQTHRGSMDDVASRFKGILENEKSDMFLRLTADCPLVMPNLMDEMIEEFRGRQCDYLSNTIEPTFPDGLDVEVVRTKTFLDLDFLDLNPKEKEHVTLRINRHPEQFNLVNFFSKNDLSDQRWTVDYQEDLDFISQIFAYFRGKEAMFKLEDVLSFLEKNPAIRNKLSGKMRNISLAPDDNLEGDGANK